ncbi:MAG: hypothetical protein WCF48_05900, partial [Terriglobales bacterium]
MDRETSLEYVHIQQRALDRAKQLIESEQEEVLAAAQATAILPTIDQESGDQPPRRLTSAGVRGKPTNVADRGKGQV